MGSYLEKDSWVISIKLKYSLPLWLRSTGPSWAVSQKPIGTFSHPPASIISSSMLAVFPYPVKHEWPLRCVIRKSWHWMWVNHIIIKEFQPISFSYPALFVMEVVHFDNLVIVVLHQCWMGTVAISQDEDDDTSASASVHISCSEALTTWHFQGGRQVYVAEPMSNHVMIRSSTNVRLNIE